MATLYSGETYLSTKREKHGTSFLRLCEIEKTVWVFGAFCQKEITLYAQFMEIY